MTSWPFSFVPLALLWPSCVPTCQLECLPTPWLLVLQWNAVLFTHPSWTYYMHFFFPDGSEWHLGLSSKQRCAVLLASLPVLRSRQHPTSLMTQPSSLCCSNKWLSWLPCHLTVKIEVDTSSKWLSPSIAPHKQGQLLVKAMVAAADWREGKRVSEPCKQSGMTTN
jgi:hypothetical protein